MIGALIILLVTIAVGLLLYVYDLRWRAKNNPRGEENENSLESTDNISPDNGLGNGSDHGEICCGRHLICEKSLVPEPGEKIVYYDDEELDRFRGRTAYNEEETEEFRDVLYTMRSDEVAGWVRSLLLRQIELPEGLKDEVFLIVGDRRQ